MPLPINNELYYGTLCIIKKKDENYVPLTLNEWNQFYNKLMNNEEHINDVTTDEEFTSSEEEYIIHKQTKDLTYEEYEQE